MIIRRFAATRLVSITLACAAILVLFGSAAYAFVRSTVTTESDALKETTHQELHLADNKISFDEYEESLVDAIACAERQGVDVSTPAVGTDGVTLDYVIQEGALGEESVEIFDKCYNDLAHSVDLYFQTSPESESARLAYIEHIVACVFGGEDVALEDFESLTEAALLGAPESNRYQGCRETMADPRSIVATVKE